MKVLLLGWILVFHQKRSLKLSNEVSDVTSIRYSFSSAVLTMIVFLLSVAILIYLQRLVLVVWLVQFSEAQFSKFNRRVCFSLVFSRTIFSSNFIQQLSSLNDSQGHKNKNSYDDYNDFSGEFDQVKANFNGIMKRFHWNGSMLSKKSLTRHACRK